LGTGTQGRHRLGATYRIALLLQALGGYGYSYLFSRFHNNYALIFVCGATALALALLADILILRKRGLPV
jgi:hypothetical protein